MAYLVEISPTAKKGLDGLPAEPQVRITGKIQSLGADPRPSWAAKGKCEGWCFAHEAYRALYEVDDAARRVLVVEVGKGKCG